MTQKKKLDHDPLKELAKLKVPARFQEELLLRPQHRNRQIIHMKNLYRVVYENYTPDDEHCTSVYQCVVEANAEPEAMLKAKQMLEAVKESHNHDIDNAWFDVDDVKNLVCTVTPLAEWLDRQMARFESLQANWNKRRKHEEDEDGTID